MNDTEIEAMRQWQASYETSCDEVLFSFERVCDLLTDQVKHRQGVTHLRDNWSRFHDQFRKLNDIFVDMQRYMQHQEKAQ